MAKSSTSITVNSERIIKKVSDERLLAFKRAMTERVVKPMEKRAAEQREEDALVRSRMVR